MNKHKRFIRIETTSEEMLALLKERGFRSYMLAILKEGVPLTNIVDTNGTVRSELAINRAGITSLGIGYSPKTDIIVKPTMADYFEMEKILKQHKRRST